MSLPTRLASVLATATGVGLTVVVTVSRPSLWFDGAEPLGTEEWQPAVLHAFWLVEVVWAATRYRVTFCVSETFFVSKAYPLASVVETFRSLHSGGTVVDEEGVCVAVGTGVGVVVAPTAGVAVGTTVAVEEGSEGVVVPPDGIWTVHPWRARNVTPQTMIA